MFISISSMVLSADTSLSVFEPSVFVVSASKIISSGYLGVIPPITPSTPGTDLTGMRVIVVAP